jgi:hypothetical protein
MLAKRLFLNIKRGEGFVCFIRYFLRKFSRCIAKEATIYTDEAGYYSKLAADFAGHEFVRHGIGEWGRGDVHTNTIEGYFSIFKRGMKGVYQHCAKKHLHRYAAEFEFRYNNRAANGMCDRTRADAALNGIVGKRVLYRDSLGA